MACCRLLGQVASFCCFCPKQSHSARETPPNPAPHPQQLSFQMSTQFLRRGMARAFYEGGYSWQTIWKRKASRVESPDNRTRPHRTHTPPTTTHTPNPATT